MWCHGKLVPRLRQQSLLLFWSHCQPYRTDTNFNNNSGRRTEREGGQDAVCFEASLTRLKLNECAFLGLLTEANMKGSLASNRKLLMMQSTAWWVHCRILAQLEDLWNWKLSLARTHAPHRRENDLCFSVSADETKIEHLLASMQVCAGKSSHNVIV